MEMDYEGAAEIERAWREGLTPDPLLTVSEWSDRHRMLSSKASAEPGRWRTSRTPYLKAIMDCLSPTSPVERVVFMKAAQLGATEMGSNWIGYVIHHAPGPMMAVWPTVEMAKRNSKQRIDPLIEESSALAELIAPARSRDSGNTILAKEFRGGVLVMTGANSAVGLRSMPVRYLFLDEVDGYPLPPMGHRRPASAPDPGLHAQPPAAGVQRPRARTLTRTERAQHAKAYIGSHFGARQQAFLDFVLDQYVNLGVTELEPEKLTPLLKLKYHDLIPDAVADLGPAAEIRGAFLDFQKALYQPVASMG